MSEQQYSSEVEFRGIIITSSLVMVSFVILCVFGFFLGRTTPDATFATAIVAFITNRFAAVPLQTYEARAMIYTVLSIFAAVIIGYFSYLKIKRIIKSRQSVQHMKSRYESSQGSAELSRIEDLKKLRGSNGIIIGYNKKKPVRFSVRASCEHSAVIGPTGCGKTSRFFIPNLLSLPENSSAVITDPKGEIKEATADELQSRGWEIYTLSTERPETSVSFNPLAIARDETEISELAEIILTNGYSSSGDVSDTQWINFSQPLWEAALLAEIRRAEMSEEVPTIKNAGRIITAYTEDERAEMFKLLGGTALERYAAYNQSVQSPETAASIRSVLTSSIKLFNRQDVNHITKEGKIFNPTWLRQKPCIFFIQFPERKTNLLKPFSATLYWQLLEHIIDIVDIPVFFFLDEFPNLGQIPGFAQAAATVRSRKISINIGLQGVEQLSREYSAEEQKDILNNMKTKIYFPGSTGESGKYTSELSGYSTIKIRGQEQRSELLTADELRRIPDDCVVVLAHNLNPIVLDSVPYFKQKKFKHLCQD